ncbi:MAG: GNAT family N-acetyltransferase [Chloroflexota bacterium]
MTDINRLQAYLRHTANDIYEAVPVPPFTAFFHPHDKFDHFNYAIPDAITDQNLRESLAELTTVFKQRDCHPRFEFISEFWPNLAESLQQYGFVEEAKTVLMTCSPAARKTVPAVANLTLTRLSQTSDLTDYQAVMDVQHEGFNMSKPEPRPDKAAAEFRDWLGDTVFVLARLDGEPVCTGSLMPPHNGLAEIAGIATRPEYRRRGIATKLTESLLDVAFEQGTDLALLTAADERAGRVYQRLGFQPVATALAYRLDND